MKVPSLPPLEDPLFLRGLPRGELIRRLDPTARRGDSFGSLDGEEDGGMFLPIEHHAWHCLYLRYLVVIVAAWIICGIYVQLERVKMKLGFGGNETRNSSVVATAGLAGNRQCDVSHWNFLPFPSFLFRCLISHL